MDCFSDLIRSYIPKVKNYCETIIELPDIVVPTQDILETSNSIEYVNDIHWFLDSHLCGKMKEDLAMLPPTEEFLNRMKLINEPGIEKLETYFDEVQYILEHMPKPREPEIVTLHNKQIEAEKLIRISRGVNAAASRHPIGIEDIQRAFGSTELKSYQKLKGLRDANEDFRKEYLKKIGSCYADMKQYIGNLNGPLAKNLTLTQESSNFLKNADDQLGILANSIRQATGSYSGVLGQSYSQ